jgi:hypothetical protein
MTVGLGLFRTVETVLPTPAACRLDPNGTVTSSNSRLGILYDH